jgi:hypothetical protein
LAALRNRKFNYSALKEKYPSKKSMGKRSNELKVLLASQIPIFVLTNHLHEQVMGLDRNTSMSVLLVLLCCFCLESGSAIDTITSSQPIKDKDYIISNGSAFKLGFFTPVNSTNRYLGIWYNKISKFTVVWVANREEPLNDSSGVLTVSDDGNLVVVDGQKEILWSSNVTNSVDNLSARLLDTGNLVLQENSTGRKIWESFQVPSDTSLPQMKISTNVKTGKKVQCTSWKSPSDPSIGSFSAGIQPQSLPQLFIWKEGSPYWRSGPWNQRKFLGTQARDPVYRDGYNLVSDEEGSIYFTFNLVTKNLKHFFLNNKGNMTLSSWDEGKEDWKVLWSSLQTECDIYGKCGAFGFGSCNSQSSTICSCLRGFEPKNTEEWNRENWTSGCVRRTPLQCERVNTSSDASKMDGFLKLNMMKVPDFADSSSALDLHECSQQCLESCSCIAYAYETGIGCMSWNRSLIDTQKFSNKGSDLYIRVAYSELGELFYHLSKIILCFKSCTTDPDSSC